jgi:hypothetical protein
VRPVNFFRAATFILWVLPLVMQCVIATVMLRRKLVGQFPFFFSYTVLVPGRDFTLSFLPNPGDRYSSVFFGGEAAAVLLSLGIIFEISWHFVRRYPFLRLFLRVLWISAIVAGAAALAMLFWAKGPAGTDVALEWITLGERSARFLQVCLLIVAIATLSRLGLTWRDYSLGIAAGFGVYAALDLVLLELRGHLHVLSGETFVLLRSAAYNLGVLIWGFYFLLPHGGNPVDRLPGTDVANWNDTLSEHVHKWYRR